MNGVISIDIVAMDLVLNCFDVDKEEKLEFYIEVNKLVDLILEFQRLKLKSNKGKKSG